MKKILMIDDDPEIVELVKSRLEANHYEVVSANDGEEGLRKVQENDINLVIVDVAMPKMDGYTFVLELKRVDALKDLPVIMLTAKDMMKPLFQVEGVKNYFIKPFVPEELLGRLKDILGE
jgi:DNA-binding response OmpR family regulator